MNGLVTVRSALSRQAGQTVVGGNTSDDFTAWGGFRAPLGPMMDALAVTQGSALFDAEQIGCDTLMLRGAQDRLSSELDATSLLNAIGAHNKRLVTFETGTHLLHLEHARDQLINEVSAFLFEP